MRAPAQIDIVVAGVVDRELLIFGKVGDDLCLELLVLEHLKGICL